MTKYQFLLYYPQWMAYYEFYCEHSTMSYTELLCYARGELVAVTGKAKSGKTYLNSILMAAAGTSALSRGAGNELEPAYNAGRMDGGNIFYNASRNFLTRSLFV